MSLKAGTVRVFSEPQGGLEYLVSLKADAVRVFSEPQGGYS